jgi:predicted nucleic-acid-binding Zn-ribbon protein
MRSGTCPKCGSDSIFSRSEGIGEKKVPVKTGRAYWPTDQSSYVCTACGYFERYLDDEGTLRKIEGEGKWTRVEA